MKLIGKQCGDKNRGSKFYIEEMLLPCYGNNEVKTDQKKQTWFQVEFNKFQTDLLSRWQQPLKHIKSVSLLKNKKIYQIVKLSSMEFFKLCH